MYPEDAVQIAVQMKIRSMTPSEKDEVLNTLFNFQINDAMLVADPIVVAMIVSGSQTLEAVAEILAIAADVDKTSFPGPESRSTEIYNKALRMLGIDAVPVEGIARRLVDIRTAVNRQLDRESRAAEIDDEREARAQDPEPPHA